MSHGLPVVTTRIQGSADQLVGVVTIRNPLPAASSGVALWRLWRLPAASSSWRPATEVAAGA